MGDYAEEYTFENEVLQVRLSGTFPNELLNQEGNLFQPVIDACSTHKCKMAIIDARNLQINLDTFQLHTVAADAAFFSRLSLRVAFLARKNMIDPFFQTVITNRDGVVGVFTDRQDAFDWLKNNHTDSSFQTEGSEIRSQNDESSSTPTS